MDISAQSRLLQLGCHLLAELLCQSLHSRQVLGFSNYPPGLGETSRFLAAKSVEADERLRIHLDPLAPSPILIKLFQLVRFPSFLYLTRLMSSSTARIAAKYASRRSFSRCALRSEV